LRFAGIWGRTGEARDGSIFHDMGGSPGKGQGCHSSGGLANILTGKYHAAARGLAASRGCQRGDDSPYATIISRATITREGESSRREVTVQSSGCQPQFFRFVHVFVAIVSQVIYIYSFAVRLLFQFFCISQVSSAFWACKRFSACWNTMLRSPSRMPPLTSSPAYRRQAVHHPGMRRRQGHELFIHLEGSKLLAPFRRVLSPGHAPSTRRYR